MNSKSTKSTKKTNAITMKTMADGMSGKSNTVVDLLMQEKPSKERTAMLDVMKRMKKATAELDRMGL